MKMIGWMTVAVPLIGALFAAPTTMAQAVTPHGTLRYIGFVPTFAPGDNPAIRQAFSCALDRGAIARAVEGPLQRSLKRAPQFLGPAYSLEAPQLPAYSAAVKACSDTERARKLWTEVGWQSPVPIFVREPVRDPADREVVATIIGATLDNLTRVLPGLQFSRYEQPLERLRRMANDGQIPVYIEAHVFTTTAPPYPSFSKHLGASIAHQDPKVRELLDKGDNTALEKYLVDEGLFIPIIRHDRFQ